MNELVIQTHDFEEAKLAIKQFSEQTTTDLDLKRVDDKKGVGEWLGDFIFGGGIGIDHKVTGEELNELTVQVQAHLRSVNSTQIKLIQQFGQVYEALDALDKDYIHAILISIKATEETSKGIAAAQEKITKIIDDQKKTLEILKKFKQKLDGYAHLGDIDKLWSDCQAWLKESSTLVSSVTVATELSKENKAAITALEGAQGTAASKIKEISNSLDAQISRIENIISFMDKLNAMMHLSDVDKMWDKTEVHAAQIAALQEQDKKTQGIIIDNKEAADTAISELQKQDEHLEKLIQINKGAVDQDVTHLQEQDVAAIKLIEENKLLTEQALAEANEQTATMMQQLNKKLMYAYLIAGGSLALAIAELVIMLLR